MFNYQDKATLDQLANLAASVGSKVPDFGPNYEYGGWEITITSRTNNIITIIKLPFDAKIPEHVEAKFKFLEEQIHKLKNKIIDLETRKPLFGWNV